jgi:hypothetical protein
MSEIQLGDIALGLREIASEMRMIARSIPFAGFIIAVGLIVGGFFSALRK